MTTLSQRVALPGRVDMAGILPRRLAGLAPGAVAELTVRLDGRPLALGELFHVRPGDPAHLVVHCEAADGARLDRLGAGLDEGCLIVEGPAGDRAGQAMRGGELILRGGCADFAASAMQGGLLRIQGPAGDWLGGPAPGERAGMAGGVVTVAGSVGQRAGERMRRGLILIRGDAGDYCASRLLAGTIAVAGRCGHQAGWGLRRGTLVLARPPASLPATFNDAGCLETDYLGLLRRHSELLLAGVIPAGNRFRRHQGDLAWGGKGEILVAEPGEGA